MTKEEILANQELSTYYDGLADALNMTKAEIRKAMKIIEEAE